MKLVGKPKLSTLIESSKETKTWVQAWVSEITKMNWKSADDILARYPNAIRVDESLFLFVPKSSNGVIEVKFAFAQGTALIREVRIEQ